MGHLQRLQIAFPIIDFPQITFYPAGSNVSLSHIFIDFTHLGGKEYATLKVLTFYFLDNNTMPATDHRRLCSSSTNGIRVRSILSFPSYNGRRHSILTIFHVLWASFLASTLGTTRNLDTHNVHSCQSTLQLSRTQNKIVGFITANQYPWGILGFISLILYKGLLDSKSETIQTM